MLVERVGWRPAVLPKFLPTIWGLTMAYAERRERNKGVRYRGLYKGADGRYRSAGTFATKERALEVAQEAERHALIAGGAGGLDPSTRATRTIKEYAPLFLRHHQVEGNTKDAYADTLRLHVVPFLGDCRLAETDRTVARSFITALVEAGRSANTIRQAKVVLGAMFGMAVADGYLDYNPFHDVKIPKVPGRRAIKVATSEQYLKVRDRLPTRSAQVFSTLMVSSGIRFCEAIGLQPTDFDFEMSILEVARSVVKVSRQHHPQGKTFLVRDYTKNGQTRRLKLDRAVVELVRGHLAEHGIGPAEVIFPADLVIPPRLTKPRLTEEQLRALGDCEPVGGRVYAHGTMGGYTRAKCRWEGCRQWARDYGRERMRVQRAGTSGETRRRWEKTRDADEPYLDRQIWDRVWALAVAESGIPFKPTAYQLRHTHASWLIDAGENPKAVMHRLGQADLRTTARYVHVLDETGESAARRFEGLLPPL
jgi:integrase